jgi:hypothetical protein
MKRMAEHVRVASSDAPVTILLDERAAGVQISYDRMASLLWPYGHFAALTVARKLDSNVEVPIASQRQRAQLDLIPRHDTSRIFKVTP